MKDVLFISMPSAFSSYKGTRLNVSVRLYPLLSFMSLGAVLREKGLDVTVLDLGIEDEPYKALDQALDELKPELVGFTATTPLHPEVEKISGIVRKKVGRDVRIVYGGPHATALPEESLRETEVDIVVSSEGEITMSEIVDGKPLADIKGIYYKDNGNVRSTPPRELIKDIDTLPFPALDLYDVTRYRSVELIGKASPTINIETSRGCPYACTYCNKNISGRLFRKKSPDRVIEEIKYVLRLGAGEIHIADDQFTVDIERAKIICEKIIQAELKFPWNLINGIRVDRVDEEFLTLAKRAGCYQLAFGIESGDQASLDQVGKGLKLDDVVRGVKLTKKVGIECVGSFMLGLPGDTEESLKKTVDFALKLMPDYAKVTITIPYPGTVLFDDYDRRGLIKSKDWSKYYFHRVGDVYTHPTLSFKTIQHYYDMFYRKYYLSPRFLVRRIAKSYSEGTLLRDVHYGLQTFFPKFFPPEEQ